MQSTHPGKEQPYPPQMTRYLDPLPLWTVASTPTSRVRLNASTLSTFYHEPPHLARLLTTGSGLPPASLGYQHNALPCHDEGARSRSDGVAELDVMHTPTGAKERTFSRS
jgi:hypothetical protein